jgi:MFS family permease
MYVQADYCARYTLFLLTCPIPQIANITSATIALPAMSSDLNIPEQRLQWVVSAYSLGSVRFLFSVMILFTKAIAQGCFLLLFGRLADLHGRKKVFTIGSLCLTVFSLSLGFANGTTF